MTLGYDVSCPISSSPPHADLCSLLVLAQAGGASISSCKSVMSATVALAAIMICVSTLRKKNILLMRLSKRRQHLHTNIMRCRAGMKRVSPGRGVPRSGSKAQYNTKRLTYRYQRLRTDPTWFSAIAHMNEQTFEALHQIVQAEIASPLDPHNELSAAARIAIRKHRKKLSSEELLFLYLEVLSGGTSGANAIASMSTRYGVCNSTIWNYIYHTGWACFRALSKLNLITWPDSEERKAMHGLIKGFPKGIMFVDGTRQPIFKNVDEYVQNDQYYGKDKMHCYAILIYVDIYGVIRRLEISYSGRLHDKTMFQVSDVFLNRTEYFSPDEQIICDAGFVGSGDRNWIIVPFKKGTGLYFEMRKEWNKDVRQRFRNEMSIGYIKNRNRIFIGCWPYSEELFNASIRLAAMIMNWTLKRNGRQLVPIENMIERMSSAEKDIFCNS